MTRRLFLLALAPAVLFAQFQLSSVTGLDDRETPIASFLDAGPTAVGNPAEIRLRLRNSGASNVALDVLRISGAGFSLSGQPPLPYIAVPGSNIDFTVRFSPAAPGAYSASLLVNSTTYLVTGTGYATATLGLRDGSSTIALSPGSAYDFGRIERGVSVTRRFVVRNASPVALSVGSLTLTGSAFRWTGQPALPLLLASQQEAAFDVTCEPLTAGPQHGTILLDQRSYPLTAFGVEPDFPRPTISADQTTPGSGQQIKLFVRLANASKVSGEGTLDLEVSPLTPGLPDDSGIQFVANGRRSITFQVRQGDTQAQFNGQPSLTLQTGTTASTLRLTARLGSYVEPLIIPIGTVLPYADTTTTARTDTELQVQVSGFDNTRSLSQVSFTFYDALGAALPGGTIRLDASREFSSYFGSSKVGGLFLMRVAFPVTGGTKLIGSVAVDLTSSAGTRHLDRISF